jgi:hypothetical protein
MALKQVGNFVARGADRVDPRLLAIIEAAAANAGLNVEAYSGFRPGDPRFHGKGQAMDVRIIGPDGKPLANYQDMTHFPTYEKLAHAARQIQMAKYPDLADAFRWGGYFSGGKGKYGALDLMHFDIGGGKGLGMAGGSWEKGLSEEQRRLWQGVKSSGIGAQAAAQPAAAPQSSGTPAPPLGPGVQIDGPPAPAMAAQPAPEESGLGDIFAAFMGGAGGGIAPQAAAQGPQGVHTGDPMAATMAAMASADRARGLAAGLAPDIEALMGLGKRRSVGMVG